MSLEAELRQLIAEGEEALRDDGWRGQGKEPLMPQYRMLLRMLARPRPVTEVRIDEWLRVVRALREQSQLARLPGESDTRNAETLLDSPLALLSARLRRLPDHVLLAVEPGTDALSWCALRGGAGPLIERAALGISSADGVRAIEQLISRHDDDVERLQSDAPVDDALFAPMLIAAQNAWNTLPAGITELVASARTVLYWASPSGSLGDLPLELLHNGTQWLGISHAVGRIASWRTLMEMLSPNRMPLSLTPSARIVRARDVAGAANLERADQEIAAVEFHLSQRGLTADVDRAPTTAALRDSFDAGVAALHVLGHGMAGSMGEYLPITSTEMLRPQDLSALSGARSPFVYLSTCELGRSRAGRSGGALGFVARMLEKGVPAAIGCIQPVNDEVALEMARAVYRRPAAMRVSDALAQARQELDSDGYPPATWGAYVLFGDPNLIVPSAANPLQQTRHLTRDWCADVSRWAALRSEDALSRACAALASGDEGIDALSAGDRAFVVAWLGSSAEAQSGAAYLDRDQFCDRIAGRDPLAGAALRVLLAIEAVDGVYARAKPYFVLASPVAELVRALQAAQATHDMVAVPALAIRLAEAAPHHTAGARLQARRLLDEAEGTLSGWVSEEPGAARLLDSLRTVRARP